MKRYLTRATKYFVYLVVLFALIYGVMLSTRTTLITPDAFWLFLASPRGLLMFGAIVGLALLYPRSGFVSRAVRLDMDRDREAVMKAFGLSGFALTEEKDGKMVFRAASPVKRALMLYEDEVVLDYGRVPAEIEGNRKAVIRVVYRMDTFLKNR